MIEFANGLDRLLQLLIIAQPAAHLGNPLATHAELTGASSRVGHRQDEYMMPRAHFGHPLVCRTVRSSSEPRSNSPVTGNLPTSFWRARRVCSRIIHKNESGAAAGVNLNSVRPCSFPPTGRFWPNENVV